VSASPCSDDVLLKLEQCLQLDPLDAFQIGHYLPLHLTFPQSGVDLNRLEGFDSKRHGSHARQHRSFLLNFSVDVEGIEDTCQEPVLLSVSFKLHRFIDV